MSNKEISIEHMEAGKPYACYFRTHAMLDKDGKPAHGQIGESFPGPGDYEGFGLIKMRDIENKMLVVYDLTVERDFAVSFDQVWGVDEVEFAEDE